MPRTDKNKPIKPFTFISLETIIRSFENILESLCGSIPKALISESWYQKMAFLARQFPSDISQAVIFESLLSSSEPKTDWTFVIDQKKLPELIQNTAYPPYDNLFNYPHWQSLRKLFQHLSGDKLASKYTDYTWLEFDIFQDMPGIPQPLIYVHITEGFYQEQNQSLAWVDPLLSVLADDNVSEDIRENIHFCFDQLFNDLQLDYIGYMPNRQKDLFRLCVSGLTVEEAYEYLWRLDLGGLVNELKAMIKDFPDYFDCFRLHVDVGKTFAPKVGLEHYFCDRFNDQEKWLPALDYLDEHFPVDKGKTKSLRYFWKKYRTFLIQEYFNYTTFRYVHHVKLVYEQDKEPLIKGYFGYTHLPI
ncbi:MAG: hypothetical protein OEZ36_12160 [Spirochaetota bacterium]|nr:hypothetical protein [Spirochaetota bacterium]